MTAPATTSLVDTSTSCVPTDDVPFVLMAPGIEVKMLRVGEKTGTYTLMTRFAPGVVLPKHRHFGEVHAYTLQGRWHYREYDWVAETGTFVYEPPNSTHTLMVPEDNTEPTVIIFTIDKGMVLVDDEDDTKLLMIQDAHSMDDLYRIILDSLGIPYPEAILP